MYLSLGLIGKFQLLEGGFSRVFQSIMRLGQVKKKALRQNGEPVNFLCKHQKAAGSEDEGGSEGLQALHIASTSTFREESQGHENVSLKLTSFTASQEMYFLDGFSMSKVGSSVFGLAIEIWASLRPTLYSGTAF